MHKKHPYWTLLDKDLSKEQPEGEDISESSEYEELSDEMIKFGSLSQGSIDWEKVERIGSRILRQKSRNVIVLRYFIQTLSRSQNLLDLACNIHLTSVFLQKWASIAYPKIEQNKKFIRLHQSNINQILKAINLQGKRLIEEFPTSVNWHIINKEINQLWEVTDQSPTEIDIVDIAQLRRHINEICNELPTEKEKKDQKDTKNQTSKKENHSSSKPPIKAPETPRFDNDRNIKKSLLAVADFISEAEPCHMSNFTLRRFTSWFDLNNLPPEKKEKKTDIPAPSIDMIAKYQERIESPDMDLWMQLEKSLNHLPFWFQGQYISYQYAIKMGYNKIAHIIQNETSSFLNKLPGLKELNYNDGSPFIDDDTAQWLHSSLENEEKIDSKNETIKKLHPRQIEAAGLDWQKEWEESFTQAKKGQIEKALSLIEGLGKKTSQPRDLFYMRIALADIYTECGYNHIALIEYQKLLNSAHEYNLTLWEPATISRLETRIDYLSYSRADDTDMDN